MHEIQVVTGIAGACSLLSILATMVVIPQLFNQINEINMRVHDGVQVKQEDNGFHPTCTLGFPLGHRLRME